MSVCDVPQPEPDNRRTRNRTVGEPGHRSTGPSVDRTVGEPDRRSTETSGGRSITKNTDTKTDLKTEDQTLVDEHSESLASLALASAEASDDDDPTQRQLNKVYDVIDAMDPNTRRRHLLTVERRRPKIYRDCRNAAIRQMEQADPDALKDVQSAEVIDRLSYKWMAKHYAPNWPQWLARPLDEAYRTLQTRSEAA